MSEVPPMAARLMARFPLLRVRSNANRQTLISLRRRKGQKGMTLSVRLELLVQEDLEDSFVEFIQRGGRGHFPLIQQRMHEVFESLPEQASQEQHHGQLGQHLTMGAGHGGEVDLDERLHRMHQQYWSNLPLLPIRWGKNPGLRALRSIRFGSYASHPSPRITIHPRLGLAWVPLYFVDHVIHHELCHHAQHCLPLAGYRREMPHSLRFKAWEGQFDRFAEAMVWQRLRIKDLLNPSRIAES